MKEDLKALKIIHMAISTGTILIYIVMVSLSIVGLKIPSFDQGNLIFLALTIVALFLSYSAFKFHLKRVDLKASLAEQFPIYRLASIYRWGILEGVAILIILFKPDLMIFGILIIINLVFLGPSEERMKTDLRSINS